MDYAISTEVGKEHAFEAVEAKVTELLATQGFGILTEIDVKAVMKKKLDIEKRPYRILGACNPPRANKVLEADPTMGIFLPCNVIVYQTESGSTIVSATNAYEMFQMVKNPEVEPVAKEVSEIFDNVIKQVTEHFS